MTVKKRVMGWSVAALALMTLWCAVPSDAHEGHAGDMLTFLETRVALKGMLPEGGKVLRRKQQVSEEGVDWARREFGVELEPSLYTFYLSRDAGGATLGAALILEVPYSHGQVRLGVGVDAAGHVTQAAVLGMHGKYVPELLVSLRRGWLPQLEGKSLAELGEMAGNTPERDAAAREILRRLHRMGAVLATLQLPVPS